LIVGGGPIGMTAALVQARDGIRSVPIDRINIPHVKDDIFDGIARLRFPSRIIL
jgi:thioredoxin reductase